MIAIGLAVLLAGLAGILGKGPSDLGKPVTGNTTLRDPFVVPFEDEYYLFSTGTGLPVRRSSNGKDWEKVGEVFPQGLPGWATAVAPEATTPWAPSLAFFEDRWHLYYSVSTFGTWTSAVGLATNPTLDPRDPAYEWTDEGVVVRSEHNDTLAKLRRGEDAWNAIDPWIVLDGQDDPWLAWGSFAGGLYLRRIDGSTGLLDQGAEVHHLARRPRGDDGIEATNLVQHDGSWYLFSSWDFCCRGVLSTYNIRVGRADEITGPYADQRGRSLLEGGGSLVLGGHDHVIGPGHSTVFREGDDWYLAHHFYDAGGDGRATLSIRPLLWTSDGWPVATNPGFVPAEGDVQTETIAGSWDIGGYASEDPDVAHDVVRFDLNGNGTVGTNAGSWSYEGGKVKITARPRCDQPGRSYELIVDEAAVQMYGRTADGAALRALRTSASADGVASPAC